MTKLPTNFSTAGFRSSINLKKLWIWRSIWEDYSTRMITRENWVADECDMVHHSNMHRGCYVINTRFICFMHAFARFPMSALMYLYVLTVVLVITYPTFVLTYISWLSSRGCVGGGSIRFAIERFCESGNQLCIYCWLGGFDIS